MTGRELKANARAFMKENAPKLFFISILFIIIVSVMAELQFRLPETLAAYQRIIERLSAGEVPDAGLFLTNFRPGGVVLAFLLFLLRPVVDFGYLSYCLKITRGEKGEYKDILNGFQFFGKVLLLSIVMTILITLWSFLFLFPGIAAYYRYRQAYYILLDSPDKEIMQCIRESKQLMMGNKLDLFLIDLSFIGWYVLDIIVILVIPLPFSLPLVSIWLTPYMGLTLAKYYDTLINRLVV